MNMASSKGQGQTSQPSPEDYWLQCIKSWYPELHSRTYFLPPLYFNRVPYIVEKVAGEQTLVSQAPTDGPSSTTRSVRLRSREQKSQTEVASPLVDDSTTILRPNLGNLQLPHVYDNDVRDDRALQRVLYCLRELADNSQPKEVMMVISQLQFGNYLGEPSYAAAVAHLPRANTLHKTYRLQHYNEGNFDVLIIHKEHGLFTLEIKSVGANFSQLKMTEEREDDAVMKKVNDAVKQLDKAEVILRHLVSDVVDTNITNIIVMPYISSGQLQRAMNRKPNDGKDLCKCLGVHSVDEAVKLCLLSDQLSEKQAPEDFVVWWEKVVRGCRPHPSISSEDYEHLLARFCGPATTVEVPRVTAPRLNIRTLGEAVSETGERTARLVLIPEQMELLKRSPPLVFVSGPPGTGKTIALIMQGLSWLRRGHDVHVVSTCDESRAAARVIEHQLKETMKTTTSSSEVYRQQFDFWKDGEVDKAVTYLKSRTKSQLCVITDEAVNDYRKSFSKFCDQLIEQVPNVHLWGASMYHEDSPSRLEAVMLTTPLRSPPIVVRELKEAVEIKYIKQVNDYSINDIFVPTDGPPIIRFSHSDGQSGHTENSPLDCVECGHQVARVLAELNVGQPAHNSKGPPPLKYRDILILCDHYPTEDRSDSNGQVIATASGMVRGLRIYGVPVRVVEVADEAAIRDTALGVDDEVTVTHWYDVHGLERKVVVVEKRGPNALERLRAWSRCTSQLVLIDTSSV